MSDIANANRRKKYRANPTPLIERAAKWREAHPTYVKDQNKQYYQKNKEDVLESNKQYRLSPEGKAAALKARVKSREKNRERARVWRLNHPGATTKQQQAWKTKNPEKYRSSNANRYAFRKRLGAANWKLSSDELSAFVLRQRGCCYYCASELNGRYHLEHKTPLSKGGAHILENLCLSCPRCNLVKHNKTEVEFRIYIHKER